MSNLFANLFGRSIQNSGTKGIVSYSADAIMTTNYEDDYTVRGYCFSIQQNITLTASSTSYVAIDFQGVSDKLVFVSALAGSADGGPVYITSQYSEDSGCYTGGTAFNILNENFASSNTPEAVCKYGVTKVTADKTYSDGRELLIGEAGNPVTARGGGGSLLTGINQQGKCFVYEIVNGKASDVVMNVLFKWFEIPTS